MMLGTFSFKLHRIPKFIKGIHHKIPSKQYVLQLIVRCRSLII